MKKLMMCMMAMLLVLCLSPAGFAAETAAEQIASLPTVEEFKAMDSQAQADAYDRTQAAYDAYMALSEEAKAELEGAEETFGELFAYFNTLVMPIEETQQTAASQEAAESGGIGTLLWIAAVALVCVLSTVKVKSGRK